MKTINYRGGVVVFRIPADWVEKYDDYEGGTFYNEASSSGILRLFITTASNSNPISFKMLAALMEGMGPADGKSIETLPSGNILSKYVQKSIEQVTPNNIRIANFSFTYSTSQVVSKWVHDEVALLEQEIRQARFSPVLGV